MGYPAGVAPAPVVYFPGPAPRKKRRRHTRTDPRRLRARRRAVGAFLLVLGLGPLAIVPTNPWVWPFAAALVVSGLYALALAGRPSPREHPAKRSG